MDATSLAVDFLGGWFLWSLSHNLGHRWWHDEMRKGKETWYAHGEREHHRIYDKHGERAYHTAEDPNELFISFPMPVIATVGILFVAAYGWVRGWPHMIGFAIGLYGWMVLDDRLHKLFHRQSRLPGLFGWFQRMHLIHHATHKRNFFFVSGLVWDCLFRTAVMNTATAPAQAPFGASLAGTAPSQTESCSRSSTGG
jgi:hypothetical protein